MSIRLYNSLTRQKEDFTPLEKGKVSMYVCGPTVYDLSHIGHARSAVAFDVIYHYLKYRGYEVTYVRNYTDVDDKIINRANQEGVSSEEIAERFIKAFDEDMAALGVTPADFRPRATETMEEMITFIQTLIDRGHAYEVEGEGVETADPGKKRSRNIYYSVRKFTGYGKLSGKNIEELESGARVEIDERKGDPLDFALWKASKPGEPFWESPWGRGRPGWHIECSAMSRKFLGDTLDIHGGGKDLIFPHHENEIAQSEAATGRPFVNYWLHNGFVNMEKEKMSKSLGNILLIRDILKQYHREVLRLFFLSSHYRSPIEYSERNLKDAEAALERGYVTIGRMEEAIAGSKGHTEPIASEQLSGVVKETHERASRLIGEFEEAMDDDFNTAIVVGQLFELIRTVNRLMDDRTAMASPDASAILLSAKEGIERVGRVLGLFTASPGDYLKSIKEHFLQEGSLTADEIEKLIAERNEARSRKDFKRADEIRDELAERGVVLEDTPKGTVWKVKD
ncbi:MAG: cysteine--tRNA ligase [Thermodesulfobacteriota bacterium]